MTSQSLKSLNGLLPGRKQMILILSTCLRDGTELLHTHVVTRKTFLTSFNKSLRRHRVNNSTILGIICLPEADIKKPTEIAAWLKRCGFVRRRGHTDRNNRNIIQFRRVAVRLQGNSDDVIVRRLADQLSPNAIVLCNDASSAADRTATSSLDRLRATVTRDEHNRQWTMLETKSSPSPIFCP